MPFLADRARMPIERANGADRAIVRLGQVVGPILGGILIAAIGAANVLFVDAASFVASAILVAIGVPAAANRAEPAAAPGGHSYLAELREGLRFIRAHTVLLSMILIATVGNFLDKPLVTVILPVYAKTFYGARPALAWPSSSGRGWSDHRRHGCPLAAGAPGHVLQPGPTPDGHGTARGEP